MRPIIVVFSLAILVVHFLLPVSEPSPLISRERISPTSTPSLIRATPSPQATAQPSPIVPIEWEVEILQNDQVVAETNGEIRLKSAPFVIRVKLPWPTEVELNVLDTDHNFKKIQAGLLALKGCGGVEWHTFCGGMGFAEDDFNKDEYLAVDTIHEEGFHALTYVGPNSHRWSNVEFSATGVIFDRNVSTVVFDKPTSGTRIPIQEYTGKLYLLFLVKFHPEQPIRADELKRVILIFGDGLPHSTPSPVATRSSIAILPPINGGSSMGFSPLFDLIYILNIALPIVGIASMIMVTVALIQSAKAQRSIARTLERIEQRLGQNNP